MLSTAITPRPAFRPVCHVEIGIEDLRVVFDLARSLEAGVVGLTAALVAVAMALQQLAALRGEDHGMVASAGNSHRLNQSLFAKIPKVT